MYQGATPRLRTPRKRSGEQSVTSKRSAHVEEDRAQMATRRRTSGNPLAGGPVRLSLGPWDGSPFHEGSGHYT